MKYSCDELWLDLVSLNILLLDLKRELALIRKLQGNFIIRPLYAD